MAALASIRLNVSRLKHGPIISSAMVAAIGTGDVFSKGRDFAYGAAHGFALAALRQKGYRSENRFMVFQALTHTVDGLDPVAVRIFAKSHNERNLAEYEGRTEVDERLLAELIRYTIELQKAVLALEPPAK
jgi:hypothetical protein